MASSRQLAAVTHAFGDPGYVQTSLKIDNIKVAKLDSLRDRFPALNTLQPNTFQRTRIEFPPPAHVGGVVGTTRVSDQDKSLPDDLSYISYNKYVSDDEVVLLDIVRSDTSSNDAIAFHRAGPRPAIPVFPQDVRAAIVCSGSLCPGQNDVIAEVFNCLYYNYGVDVVYGINGGFHGFFGSGSHPWQVLTPELIRTCIGQGGSILGSSRGGFDLERIVSSCQVYGVTQLYLIGGDGSHLAASLIDQYCKEHHIMLSVCCIPSSVENDLAVIDSSFGFGSALAGALEAIESAVVEARCVPNGVGIVKVTGKHSGCLACHAVLASNHVSACIIPEGPFELYGPRGLLEYVYKVVQRMSFAVIVVSEGAASTILESNRLNNTTNSINNNSADVIVLDKDGTTRIKTKQPSSSSPSQIEIETEISPADWLKEQIEAYFKHKNSNDPAVVRMINATTACRSIPATPTDRVHCLSLSNNAVHACMYGYTAFSSAIVNNRSVLIPSSIIAKESPSSLTLDGRTYERVRTLTQQPRWDSFDQRTIDSAQQFTAKKLGLTQHSKL